MELTFLAPAIIAMAFMTADLLSGFGAAVKNKNVISSKMREGLWHKAGLVGLIALAFGLEHTSNFLTLGFSVPAVNAVCVWIVLIEVISIIENLGKLNEEIMKSPIGEVFKVSQDKLAGKDENAGDHARQQ